MIRAGEVHALLGENGVGKSAIVKVLSGRVRPDSGVLSIFGNKVARFTPLRRRAGRPDGFPGNILGDLMRSA